MEAGRKALICCLKGWQITLIDFSITDNCCKDKTVTHTQTHTLVHTEPVTETTALRNFLWSCNTRSWLPRRSGEKLKNLNPIVPQAKNMLATSTRTLSTTADLNLFCKGKENMSRWFAVRFPIILLPSLSGVKLYLWADILRLYCQTASNLIWCRGITLIICNYHSNSHSQIAALIGQKPNFWRSLR